MGSANTRWVVRSEIEIKVFVVNSFMFAREWGLTAGESESQASKMYCKKGICKLPGSRWQSAEGVNPVPIVLIWSRIERKRQVSCVAADRITGVGKVSCSFLYSVTLSDLLAGASLHRI